MTQVTVTSPEPVDPDYLNLTPPILLVGSVFVVLVVIVLLAILLYQKEKP